MSASQFQKAVEIIGQMPKDGPVQPSSADQLKFYSLYKQATVGDVNTARPGMMDFTGKAKWDAWKGVEGTSTEEAHQQYVDHLLELLEQHSDNEESQKYMAEIKAA